MVVERAQNPWEIQGSVEKQVCGKVFVWAEDQYVLFVIDKNFNKCTKTKDMDGETQPNYTSNGWNGLFDEESQCLGPWLVQIRRTLGAILEKVGKPWILLMIGHFATKSHPHLTMKPCKQHRFRAIGGGFSTFPMLFGSNSCSIPLCTYYVRTGYVLLLLKVRT